MRDIRVRLRKLSRVKYISHLDLTRTMTRAVRRAKLPVWYTEGFNRHPYLTFAAPLSLGVEGTGESMDFRIIEEIPMEEIVSRLNAVLPEGLEVYEASVPVMKAGDIAFAGYRLKFTGCIQMFRDFLQQESISAQKRSKKGVFRGINLKPSLDKAAVTYQDDTVWMEIVLPCSSAETINPMLITSAYKDFIMKITGEERPVFCEVVRFQLSNKDKLPFA